METNSEILLTRQRHEADIAGLHYDIRMVIGDKAYSWATYKDMPKPGESIILHQQPTHTSEYALSKKVVIPSGQYGAGITTLDWVKKGRVEKKDGYRTITLKSGEKYLLKHVPKYSEKAWLFKNLTEEKPKNKYLEKIATTIYMYEHEDTGLHTWVKEGDPIPGKRWFKTNKVKHIPKKVKHN